jgi:hypothetical protein
MCNGKTRRAQRGEEKIGRHMCDGKTRRVQRGEEKLDAICAMEKHAACSAARKKL